MFRGTRWQVLGRNNRKGFRNWTAWYVGHGLSGFEALALSVDSVLTSYPVRLPLPCEVRELAGKFAFLQQDAIIAPCGEHRWARILHWLAWAKIVMPISRLSWNGKDYTPCEHSLDPTLRMTSIADNMFLRSVLAIDWIIANLSTDEELAASTTSPGEARRVPPARVKALSQWKSAIDQNPALSTESKDREVYDWLEDHCDGDRLPSFETWSRYLREARSNVGLSKNSSRRGRTSRSAAKTDQL